MQPVILFRADRDSQEEKAVAKNYFNNVYSYRTEIPEDSLVIGRYSVLPFYRELQTELNHRKSTLINATTQHQFIANFDWYHYISDMTPRTWFDTTEAYQAFDSLPHGMVLKGRTNSSKSWEWMYAPTKDDFWRIDKFLHQHTMIAEQGVVYREYVPLKVIEKSAIPNSFDFVNEWRCFFYKKQLLVAGYYWSVASEEALDKANNQNLGEMLQTAIKAAKKLADHTNFFVVDVAQTVEGKWVIIEVNDGQMSGLSMCNPDILYQNLKFFLETENESNNL